LNLKIEFDFSNVFNFLKSTAKKINIIHIFLIVLALHLFIMSTPETGFIFDEAHYVPAARNTINMIAANAEHTPLAKMFIGWSIQSFGDWWFAWRLPSVIFSSLSVVFVYFIALHFMPRKYALFAGAFMSLDVLFFVNGSIAILDPPAVFFALVGTYLMLKDKYIWSSIAFSLAVLSKETSLLILAGVALYKLSLVVKQKNFTFKRNFKPTQYFKSSSTRLPFSWKNHNTTKTFFLFFIIFVAMTFGGIYAYDVVYKPSQGGSETVGATVFVANQTDPNLPNFNQSIPITTSLTTQTNNNYITNPIQHIIFAFNYYRGLTPTINPDNKDLRPAWSWTYPIINAWNPPTYFGVSVTVGTVTRNTVSYQSQVSYPISVFLIPTLILCFYSIIKKSEDKFPLLYIGWLATTYLPWILFSLFVQKMTFNYYFMYTVPIFSIGLPWFFQKLPVAEKTKTYMLALVLTLALAYFIYYFPLNMLRA
jgi:hypothetical protein